jgi:hypothetical protein
MPTNPVKVDTTDTKIVLLDNSTTPSESSHFVSRLRYIYNYLYLTIASGGSVEIFTSPNGEDTWIKFGDTITTNSVVTLPPCVPFVKVVRNAGTQSVTAILCSGGRDRS